jgi:ParB-like chromosome segregation protein Spo0J
MSNLKIQYVSPDRLRPYPGNARSHSRKQLKLIENSIKRFGFTNPILVTDDFEVVAGPRPTAGREVIGHAAGAGHPAQFSLGG